MQSPTPLSGSYEDLFEQANYHLRMGDIEEARSIFERLYTRLSKLSEKSFKRRPDLLELKTISTEALGVILRRQGEYDQALDLYQGLIEETPPEDHAEWHHAIARLKIDRGEVETGLDELRALAVMNSDQAWPWFSLGQVLLDLGDLDEAEANLIRATERESDNREDAVLAYFSLFTIYKRQKRFDEAEKAWRKVMQTSEAGSQNVAMLYKMYLDANELERAEYWINKEKNPLRLGFYRGMLAQVQGDGEKAVQLWGRTFKKDPLNYDEGYDAWAEAGLRTDQKPEEIIYVLESLIQPEKIAPRGVLLMAIAQVRNERPESAHTILKTMVGSPENGNSAQSNLLSAEDWRLFSELIDDEETLDAFKTYFEVDKAEEINPGLTSLDLSTPEKDT